MRRWVIASLLVHAAVALTTRVAAPPARALALAPHAGLWLEFVAAAPPVRAPVASVAPVATPAPIAAPAPAPPPPALPARSPDAPSAPRAAAARGAHLAPVPHATLAMPAEGPTSTRALEAHASEASLPPPPPPPAERPAAPGPAAASAPPPWTAADLLRATPHALSELGSLAPTPALPAAPPRAATFAGRDEATRGSLRQVTQGYLEQVLADGHVVEPPAVHGYFNAVARRLRETWRPGFYRTPDMVDALMAMPRRMAAYAERYRRRAEYYGRTGRPDDPSVPAIPDDFEERSTFSTRTTISIVEVEQDATGQVLSLRVVRPARIRSFDAAALAAVREGLPNQSPVPMPGGRRSRFAFEVVVSRDAIVPMAGFTFNENNGFFEMHYPGALHVRTRVRPLGSRALSTPWPLPRRTD